MISQTERTRLWVVLLLCQLALFSIQPAAIAQSTDARDVIQKQGKAFMDAATRGDAAAMAKVFATDAKLLVSNREVIVGRAAIQDFWQAALNGRLRGLLLKIVDLDGDGTLRVETGDYVALGEGQKELDRGHYVIVWKRENGEWKIHRDIANTSLPAAH